MTPAAQSAALAKHLGLDRQYVLMKRGYYYRPNAQGYTDQLSEAWRVSEEVAEEHARPGEDAVTMHPVPWPDWAGDLNAIHQAEGELSPTSYLFFCQRLEEICVRDADPDEPSLETYPVYASARQRLEALLRTLSLWDDTL